MKGNADRSSSLKTVNSTFALENRNTDPKLTSKASEQVLINPYQLDMDPENIAGYRY